RRHTISIRDWSSDVCSYDLDVDDEDITDVKGKICLSTGGMSSDLRKKLVARGAVGYNTTWGGFYDDEIMKTQVPHRTAVVAKDRSEERRVGKKCSRQLAPIS